MSPTRRMLSITDVQQHPTPHPSSPKQRPDPSTGRAGSAVSQRHGHVRRPRPPPHPPPSSPQGQREEEEGQMQKARMGNESANRLMKVGPCGHKSLWPNKSGQQRMNIYG
ncbi:unnamed protein product [Bursaphelenchus okinawaensis]|uniref:Uncharacterized protein n=1 Tax=Bursaphelenchus okinawaensis TaxID=465554 RepID=A0A811JUP0_9BILA|nr:unnamed protein product [Bursaphelenchus okinawaensis]CAG9083381.1 unnamed protein product [Bursaphelenchus okinawaensis]